MKTRHISKIAGSCGFTLAITVIAGLTMVSSANAQYRPAGDDGITASPKVRAQLEERKARLAASASLPTMVCSKCKDLWVAQADSDSKGSGARTMTGTNTKYIAKHLCDGCGTDLSVTGTGKAKQTAASHKCSGCGEANLACCYMKGSGDLATKGMEQKIQVAPLK